MDNNKNDIKVVEVKDLSALTPDQLQEYVAELKENAVILITEKGELEALIGQLKSEKEEVEVALQIATDDLKTSKDVLAKSKEEIGVQETLVLGKKEELQNLIADIASCRTELTRLNGEKKEAAAKIAEASGTQSDAIKKVSVKFVIPKFNLNGVEYDSKELETAAQAGDEAAQEVILELVKLRSGVIEIVNEGGE